MRISDIYDTRKQGKNSDGCDFPFVYAILFVLYIRLFDFIIIAFTTGVGDIVLLLG